LMTKNSRLRANTDWKIKFLHPNLPIALRSRNLFRRPHVPNSAKVKTVMVRKTGSAYWLGKVENESLQRVYGISFPDKAQMKAYKTLLAEAAKRDHRVIGKDQKLFMFHPLSPGSAFLLPHGARIYSTLVEFLREEYWRR